MIKRVILQNFKSFADEINATLHDLLVIAGPNSCGKTTLIQALLLLSQTLDNPRQDVALDLGGNYVQFAEFRDAVFGRPANKDAKFTIGFDLQIKENDVINLLSEEDFFAEFYRGLSTLANRIRRIESPSASVERTAHFRVTFGATRTGKPTVNFLSFEKKLHSGLVICNEIEKVGKKYRVTSRITPAKTATESEIVEMVEQLSERTKYLNQIAAEFPEPNSSIRGRFNLGFFLDHLLTFYGLSWEKLPEAFGPVKRDIEALRLPRLPANREWPGHLATEINAFAKMLINYATKIASDSVSQLAIPLDHFFPTTSLAAREYDSRLDQYLFAFNLQFGAMVKEIRQYLKRFEYIGPLRAKPERVYLPTGTPPDIGSSGENAIPILWLEQGEKVLTKTKPGQEPYQRRMDQAVREWFDEFGIAQSIHVTKPRRVIYQAELDGPPGSKTKVTIADVGFGVSQLLPVIVAGLRSPRNSTIIFEQPEIHLHPRLQAKLADFLVCLMELDKRIIVETHSEHLINMLRLRIVEDKTDELQKRTGILFVQSYAGDKVDRGSKEQKGKGSFVSNLQVNEYGQIINWPSDFFSEYGDLNEQILRAMMSRHKGDNQ